MLVVARGRGRAGGEDDLAAVLVGVGGEEGDLLALDRPLDVRDQDVELVGGLGRPRAR